MTWAKKQCCSFLSISQGQKDFCPWSVSSWNIATTVCVCVCVCARACVMWIRGEINVNWTPITNTNADTCSVFPSVSWESQGTTLHFDRVRRSEKESTSCLHALILLLVDRNSHEQPYICSLPAINMTITGQYNLRKQLYKQEAVKGPRI